MKIFNWYETNLGTYPFGSKVASVELNWGVGSGGMEHHPYWHVHSSSIGGAHIHAREAALGWYGNGVRFKCWEDRVLSEGPVESGPRTRVAVA